MKLPIQRPRLTKSLTVMLALAFFALSMIALLISGGLQLWFNIRTQQTIISSNQQLIAQKAARTVSSFIQEKFSVLETAVWLTNLNAISQPAQKEIMSSLLGRQPALRQLALFDSRGKILIQVSRLSAASHAQFRERLRESAQDQYPHNNRTISPVYIDPVTSEPMVMMTVPIIDVFGDYKGALTAEVNLKFMWDLVDQLQVGQTGYAYVVDRDGDLIAFGDMARVLKGENVAHLPPVQAFVQGSFSAELNPRASYLGMQGGAVVGTYVALGVPNWAVITETPWMETYRDVIHETVWSVVIILLIAILASLLGVYLARRLARPLVNLTRVATRIAGGEQDLQAVIEGPTEVTSLASAFNSMTRQLHKSLQDLEQQIAERRLAEDYLRLTRFTVENIADATYWIDPETTRIVDVNEAACRMLGYTREEMLNLSLSDIDPGFSLENWPSTWQRIKQTGKGTISASHRARDGRLIPVDIIANYIEFNGRELDFAVVRDVTERKQAEEQLHYQASLLQNVSDAIIATDLDFRIISWNRAAETLYGHNADDVIGQPVDDLLQIEYVDSQPETVYRQILEQGFWKGEVIQKHLDGRRINILASVSSIRDGAGKPVGAVAVNHDMTQRKLAEAAQEKLGEQLRQAQKLESIGQLAGSIAHDFNNMLVPIIGYAGLGQKKLEPDNKVYTYLEKISTAAEKAASLVSQILAFSRRQVLEIETFNLNEMIAEFQKMLRRLITEEIEVQVLLSPTPCLVRADRTQIEQILLNLSTNAQDAMPGGGKLVIETSHVYLDEAYAQSHSQTQPGHYVMLSLSDTGEGMNADTRKQIFEPFFTTKKKGKGTGLGLATVFGIVKQHQGNIWVYSEPGRGTTFKIYLPRVQQTATLTAVEKPELTSVFGTETVMVVEDEPMVRALACETLKAHGYTVIEAESPKRGLQLASEFEGPIQLLLTDVIMPDMNGREFHEKLAARRPDTKVLYMSGYTDNVIAHHGVLEEGIHFLQKPFTVHDLTHKVRRVLDMSSPEPSSGIGE
ncbi:MAG: PAS domain S-box protein [bacterium]